MMFIDQASIRVKAGDGGSGCIAFRREKYVPRGGPSGGDGGSGGSIWIVASRRLNTLYHLQFQREWKAGRGQHGMGSNCSGYDGDDVTIELPIGSVVRDKTTGEIVADLTHEGERILVAKGGRGGWGNQHFATATRQAPRFAQDGNAGDERELFIELKLIADVGLVGFPNAGKSTLISVISAAKPKIADYPFTTLEPHLGVVRFDGGDFVVADIPGLIEGASEGRGLGHQFLRHIERARVLLVLIDLNPSDGRAPEEQERILLDELERYQPDLAERPRLVVGSKADVATMPWDGPRLSAATREGLQPVVYAVADLVRHARANLPEPAAFA